MKSETKAKPARKPHTVLSVLLATLVLLIGLALLLYPTVADYVNSLNFRKEIRDYQQNLRQLDDSERQAMLEAAHAWNDALPDAGSRIGGLDAERRQRYAALLDPFGTGMMGYIEIEKAGIYLPVYHGTAESVLQTGVGHIEGSSLPVGGVGTHTILSGHTGLPSSKLFSNIDQLEVGDLFLLHILGGKAVVRPGRGHLHTDDLYALRRQFAPPAGEGRPDRNARSRATGPRETCQRDPRADAVVPMGGCDRIAGPARRRHRDGARRAQEARKGEPG